MKKKIVFIIIIILCSKVVAEEKQTELKNIVGKWNITKIKKISKLYKESVSVGRYYFFENGKYFFYHKKNTKPKIKGKWTLISNQYIKMVYWQNKTPNSIIYGISFPSKDKIILTNEKSKEILIRLKNVPKTIKKYVFPQKAK